MSEERLRVVIAEPAEGGFLERIFTADSSTNVVGIARNGDQAVALTKRLRPDAVVADAGLPDLDAYELAHRIMSDVATPIVMVTDSGNADSLRSSMEGIRGGALLAVNKPSASVRELSREHAAIIGAVRMMAGVKLVHRRPNRARPLLPASAPATSVAPAVVAIGASTGGPQALQQVLKDLSPDFRLPILVTQHIASGFTSGMVRWLDSTCRLNVKVAQSGESLRGGIVYVADDDAHLTVARNRTVALKKSPPIDGHRPSATALFRSVAEVFGSQVLAVILTGMGKDGVDGLAAVRRAGGTIVAQDEESCAVFGMPKAAIERGIAHDVASLEAIGELLMSAGK